MLCNSMHAKACPHFKMLCNALEAAAGERVVPFDFSAVSGYFDAHGAIARLHKHTPSYLCCSSMRIDDFVRAQKPLPVILLLLAFGGSSFEVLNLSPHCLNGLK